MRRKFGRLCLSVMAGGLAVSLAISFAMSFSRPAAAERYDTAVLQGLDKVTARVVRINAPVGQTVKFGTLEIIARTCDKRPPEDPPESAAFLDIWEVRRGDPAASIYRGWMYASSPALAAMEHPVYDVWVLDCKNSDNTDASNSGSNSAK